MLWRVGRLLQWELVDGKRSNIQCFIKERNKFQNLRGKKKREKKKLYRGTFIPSTVIKHDPVLQFTLCEVSNFHIQSMSLKSAEGCLNSELLLKSPLLPPPPLPPSPQTQEHFPGWSPSE